MTKILVYYYIQSDPWESLKEPNVYALEKKYNNAGEVTVRDTYDCFPIKSQKYYLRYFIDDAKQNLKGWLDLPPSAKAPVYNDKVYVKAMRLPSEVNLTFKNDLYKKNTSSDTSKPKTNNISQNNLNPQTLLNNDSKDSAGKIANSKSPNKVLSSNSNNNQTNNNNNIRANLQTQKFNSQGGKKEIINMQQKENNLLNFDSEIKFQENKKNEDPYNINNIDLESIVFHEEKKSNNENSNIDKIQDTFGIFNNISSQNNEANRTYTPIQQPSAKSEFDLGSLGLDFTAPTTTNNNTASNNNNKPTNEKQNDIHNFTKEPQLFDLPPLQVDPNSLDNFSVREMCDPIINQWVKGEGFEKKNIRMLLSTLHEIWKGDNWVKLSLGDVLEDNKLKKAYQRSILQIHPDKIHSSDPRMKYCAERVCNIITEAFNESKK